MVERKLQANLSILTSSVWTWLVPVCLAFVAFLALRRTGYLHRLQRRVPGVRACLLGALVVGHPRVRVERLRRGRARDDVRHRAALGHLAAPGDGAGAVTVVVGFAVAVVLAIVLLAAAAADAGRSRSSSGRTSGGAALPVAAGLVIVLAVLAGRAACYSPVVLWSDDGPLDRPLDRRRRDRWPLSASGCSGSSTTWPAPAAAAGSGATSARWPTAS